ncbi:hypothetical protein ACFFNY_20275 [Paenibacillus hodogayensis]|uniref:Uncharacterized protein n=1 Tax=Paenibacillus hodogayensis TaxID=279208 RepID=A0ABV5W082_9BACL
MNIQWIFPDNQTWETNVGNINKLLFTMEVVDSISIKGVSYKTVRKELVVREDQFFVSISLAQQTIEPDKEPG